jgi:single-strand DNA-binding protein
MINKVILMGRLCADPEFRQTTSGVPVCRIRLAVNRPKQKDKEQEADFINVTCWRATAEFVSRYFTKGKMAIVEGSLRNNDFTDNNGVKHYSMDVLAQNVMFGESKNASSESGQPSQPAQAPQYGSVPAPNNNPYAQHNAPQTPAQSSVPLDIGEFEEVLSDGDTPF